MSTEVKKRGRPKKIVEAIGALPTEKIPNSKDLSTPVRKPSRKTLATAKFSTRSSKAGGAIATDVLAPDDVLNSTANSSSSINVDGSVQETSPPPSVAKLIQLEESRILKEIVKSEEKRTTTAPVRRNRKLAVRTGAKVEEVIPPLEPQAPAPAAHLQPVNTLAMGYPIPTYQSSRQTVGLRASHCLPWLPNPSILPQALYLSTTTRIDAASKRRLPSLKEANKFVVTEQSSRGGPGSGAANSRAQQGAEEARGSARPELLMNGEMPAKYKPALRRVQAIIVALPIVIVTSWMLYERQFLGAEQKKMTRLPSGSTAISQSETGSSSSS